MFIKRFQYEFTFQLAAQLATTVLIATASYLSSRNLLLAAGITFGGVLIFTCGYYLGIQAAKHLMRSVSIAGVYPFKERLLPIDRIPINQRIDGIRKEFLFIGVSAKILWSSNLYRMMASPEYAGCRFRFLLLDPSLNTIARRIKDEGQTGSLEAAKKDVESFLDHLQAIKMSFPQANISCHLYDVYPGFWLMLCDNTLYVQPFPKRTIGKNSSLMILTLDDKAFGTIFEGFMNQVEDIRENQSKLVF